MLVIPITLVTGITMRSSVLVLVGVAMLIAAVVLWIVLPVARVHNLRGELKRVTSTGATAVLARERDTGRGLVLVSTTAGLRILGERDEEWVLLEWGSIEELELSWNGDLELRAPGWSKSVWLVGSTGLDRIQPEALERVRAAFSQARSA